MISTNKSYIRYFIISSLLFMANCETVPVVTTDITPVPIKTGFVKNKDITISAVDGSFSLKGGEKFNTPFSAHAWGIKTCSLGNSSDNWISAYKLALDCGAKEVEVIQDGEDPLYGVLFLNSAIPSATGPSSRSYLISINQSVFDDAMEGNTSIAYESLPFVQSWSDGTSTDKNWRSWILWVSSVPFI